MGLLQMIHGKLKYVFGGYLNEGKKCSAHNGFFACVKFSFGKGVWWRCSCHSKTLVSSN